MLIFVGKSPKKQAYYFPTFGLFQVTISGSKSGASEASTSEKAAPREDIMSVLMAYEKKGGSSQKTVIPNTNDSDSDMEDPDDVNVPETSFNRPGESITIEDDDGMHFSFFASRMI
jgi:hypothetical protein